MLRYSMDKVWIVYEMILPKTGWKISFSGLHPLVSRKFSVQNHVRDKAQSAHPAYRF